MLYRSPETEGETKEQYLKRMIADYAVEHDLRNDRAQAAIREADNPCDGDHQCEDDHGDQECGCDLDCDCRGPEEARHDALVEATLAQAAALAMNSFALMLAHRL